jgi:hypothetical protein
VTPLDQADHDLLVRIDEQVKNLRVSIEAAITRIAAMERNVNSLQMSRVQLLAISGTLSTAIALLMKLFWK